jgi:hypothetical protein
MKHLKKFEAFTIDELNENIFQDAFGFIKQKISNWKDKFTQPFNAAVDYINSNLNNPEIQNAIVAINELPESEMAKIDNLINNPDKLHNNMINAEEVKEAFDINLDKFKNIGSRILGTSVWAIPAVMTVIKVFIEHTGPGNYTQGQGTAAYWLIATIAGICIAMFIAAKRYNAEKTEKEKQL